jgi:hypothetical protein
VGLQGTAIVVLPDDGADQNMQQIHIKCMYIMDIVHLVGIKKILNVQ